MQRRPTHTPTRPLALGEDSLHLSAFRNLLSLTSPGAPTLLSLSSSSLPSHTVRLRSCWDVFYSFPVLVPHFHYTFPSLALFFVCQRPLFLSRCTVLIFCPPPCVSPGLISKCKCRLCLGHQDFCFTVTPSLVFFPLSVPACRVCLLWDYSKFLQRRDVTRDDLHLIRAPRWGCETCWSDVTGFFSSC